ncbi:MAG TPA: hypothetical protein DEF47_09520 [Herpetosiphon sp.]|uniref:Uncharacterized protein n=1 Tax=Herpetosiphon aurantiacus (strain ATCC 23779 / DSM 785 / 114-95) TaxID=316274 RepID=A9B3V6_HERA2|nr:hypothetical protein [Herpetosiphon sp.]ABX06092.1 hypothetical protein Haur_3456 [Herpetosiphon aurantiacus DSM 785]HBW50132.1 hypothetical protein [Herpetosiphon sp.]
MAEFPTLQLHRQSLLNAFRDVQAKGLDTLRAYEWVKLARCAYYLRDPLASTYLQQAAAQQAIPMEFQIASLNFYRMAGDQAALQACFRQLPTKPAGSGQWAQATYQWAYFQALFWLGDDRECIKRYHHEASLQTIALAKILAQLAEARLNRNASQALAVAQRLAEAIREERLEPWSNLPLNLWDLYELSCQLLDPPLSIDAALIQATVSPAQRLLELLQAEQIVALEWAIYNNDDEADIGYRNYTLADGTTTSFGTGFVNQELERMVWDIMNVDWGVHIDPNQQFGIYRLEVAKAVVQYMGELWTSYDFEEMEADGSINETYLVVQHPTDPELYMMYLPEVQRQTVDLARWNGQKRRY